MKKIILITFELLFLLGLFFPTYSTQATSITFYVDNTNPACSDSGAGVTPSQPFCTIGMGAGVASAGNTVRVLAGTYAERIRPDVSGSPGYPITFSAAPGVTVTSDPITGKAFTLTGWSYITVDGFNVTHTSLEGIFLSGSDHIIISNNHVSYAGGLSNEHCGIYLSATTNSTITGNITDHNFLDGIRLINGSTNNTVSNNISFANSSVNSRTAVGIDVETNSTSNTIIHNIVYANDDSGLTFQNGSSLNLIIGNVSYGNGDHGIDNNASPYNTIVGNTVQGNVTSGINLEGAALPGSSGATILNNIMADNGLLKYTDGGTITGVEPGNIRVDLNSTPGTILDYNLYYLTSGGTQIIWAGQPYLSVIQFSTLFPGKETNGVLNDPLFTLPAPIAMRPRTAPFNMAVNVGNYYIKAGSPAIDSANSNATGEPLHDILGRPRMNDLSVGDSGFGVRTYDDRGAYEFLTWRTVMLPTIIR
jgi:parallel beta-helix repeat protein